MQANLFLLMGVLMGDPLLERHVSCNVRLLDPRAWSLDALVLPSTRALVDSGGVTSILASMASLAWLRATDSEHDALAILKRVSLCKVSSDFSIDFTWPSPLPLATVIFEPTIEALVSRRLSVAS